MKKELSACKSKAAEVVHSPHHPKIKGLSLITNVGIGREKMSEFFIIDVLSTDRKEIFFKIEFLNELWLLGIGEKRTKCLQV